MLGVTGLGIEAGRGFLYSLRSKTQNYGSGLLEQGFARARGWEVSKGFGDCDSEAGVVK